MDSGTVQCSSELIFDEVNYIPILGFVVVGFFFAIIPSNPLNMLGAYVPFKANSSK